MSLNPLAGLSCRAMYHSQMPRTVEAVIGPDQVLQPVEPIELVAGQRVLVTVLSASDAVLLAEPALRDWLHPDEEARWSFLSQELS